jgi:hypothetical protein
MLDRPTTADNPETPASVAPAAPARKSRTCPNCGEEFYRPVKGPGGHKRFCSTPCRQRWENRALGEGKAVVTIMKIWAANRNNEVGNLAFQRLREAADLLNNRDVEEGRIRLKAGGPLDPYIQDVLAEPLLDRIRR